MTDRGESRSAGVPPAVSGASRPRFGEVTIRDRGRIPHWEKDAATYFVTFRLVDSLPKTVLDRIESERRNIVTTANQQLRRDLTSDERNKLLKLSTKRIEHYLDSGAGSCHMRTPAIAEIVAESLRHFDDQRYRLFAFCIMPNHVHVVFRLFPGQKLAQVVHSWKSFSAKQVNKLLGTSGAFWQREYFDHMIRDESQFERAIQYVADNPVKAGLQGWRWVWVGGRDAHPTAGETPALPRTG